MQVAVADATLVARRLGYVCGHGRLECGHNRCRGQLAARIIGYWVYQEKHGITAGGHRNCA